MAALLDLDNPEAWQDLSAAYAPARAAGPVYVGENGSVIVLRHAQAGALLKDPAFGVTDLLALYGITQGPAWEWWRQVMASLNPPDHTRVRATVSRAFTPRAVDKLRPRIRALATELLDDAIAVAGGGEIDVISHYANQLPSRVMADILAIPNQDQARFAEWTSDIGLIFGAAVAKDSVRLHRCLGAALARAELQESILLLARRVQEVSLTETPTWVPYASIRRFAALTVRLRLP